jgi:hypothetical protein
MKQKKYTQKQAIASLENTLALIYTKVIQLDGAVGEIQKLIDIKKLRQDEEE